MIFLVSLKYILHSDSSIKLVAGSSVATLTLVIRRETVKRRVVR